MKLSDRFQGCIIAGAIGDAYGSSFENLKEQDETSTAYPFGKREKDIPTWQITDDTQLTLATCETIIENKEFSASKFAQKYLDYFVQKKISGIGATTLKALQELQAGGHWRLVGRKGEFAAGNGAAMRIAPTAFVANISRQNLQDICKITHNNDEAYVGGLAVNLAIKAILNNKWTGRENLIEIIINEIPDTRLRDRLMDIKDLKNLKEIGELGNDGYVVNSIPLAIAAASQVANIGLEEMFNQLIQIGGDTDTNASIAGQIAGTLIGRKGIPVNLMSKLQQMADFKWIEKTINKVIIKENWV